MNKISFVIMIAITCLLFSETAQAVNISLNTAQHVYKPGDNILVTVDIYNDYDYEVEVILEYMMTSQKEIRPDSYIPYDIILSPAELKTITLFETNVTENFPSDEYTVMVRVFIDDMIYEESEITFQVEDTLQKMQFEIQLCKDNEDGLESMIYLQGENIYLNYISDIENIDVVGTIQYPNGSNETHILPFLLQTNELGSYSLQATASKKGYKNETKVLDFAVIDKEANIPMTSLASEKPIELPIFYLIIIAIVVIAVLTSFLVIKSKKR